jgi:hypothetical protein
MQNFWLLEIDLHIKHAQIYPLVRLTLNQKKRGPKASPRWIL